MHLPIWGLRLPATNKHKQLTPQKVVRHKQIQICHVAKRCGRRWPVADVSVRLVLVVEIVEISDREQEKTLFFIQNIDYSGVKRWRHARKARKKQKNAEFNRLQGSIFLEIAKISAKIADCHNMTHEECIFVSRTLCPAFFACRRKE